MFWIFSSETAICMKVKLYDLSLPTIHAHVNNEWDVLMATISVIFCVSTVDCWLLNKCCTSKKDFLLSYMVIHVIPFLFGNRYFIDNN